MRMIVKNIGIDPAVWLRRRSPIAARAVSACE